MFTRLINDDVKIAFQKRNPEQRVIYLLSDKMSDRRLITKRQSASFSVLTGVSLNPATRVMVAIVIGKRSSDRKQAILHQIKYQTLQYTQSTESID